jgi:hypothetical protein
VRRRHGGGCSGQLAAPACSLFVLNVCDVGEKKKRRKEEGERRGKRKRKEKKRKKGKNMEIFPNLKISEK